MLNLNGIVSIETLHELRDYSKLRLKNPDKFLCSEALALYEQRLIDNDKIFDICQIAMGEDLYTPAVSYISPKIISHFVNPMKNRSRVVPVSVSPQRKMIVAVYLPELGKDCVPYDGYKVELLPTTIYYYFNRYVEHFGKHPELNTVPAKYLFDSIVNEAIALGAMDITIESVGNTARTFYNVRKKKIYSQRIITYDNLEDIIKILCIKSPMDNMSNAPKYVGVDLTEDYRGRVVINKTFRGYAITIRVLPNAAFNKKLEDLNMSKEVVKMIRRDMMNREKGIRLFVGATASGKNTSNLAILNEVIEGDNLKVISVEMPVEQYLDGVIQINSETEEEFTQNVSSLLRQNPDIVYITEIGDTNAQAVMRAANTGQTLYSTLHANGCSQVIGRLMDITGLPVEKIVEVMHSVIYQELVRDEETDTVYPRNRYFYFSEERKNMMLGKPYGEIVKLIKSWEGGDLW